MTTGRTSGRKTKRRKTIKPPRRSATTATPQTSDKKKIALLTRKLREALEQQTATTEILRVRLSGRRGIGDADQGVGPSHTAYLLAYRNATWSRAQAIMVAGARARSSPVGRPLTAAAPARSPFQREKRPSPSYPGFRPGG